MTEPTPDRQAFIEEFVIELTKCQRAYVSVHKDDKTNWSAAELGSLAHDVLGQMSPSRSKLTVDDFVAVFNSYGDDYDLETVHDLVALANGEETATALGATE